MKKSLVLASALLATTTAYSTTNEKSGLRKVLEGTSRRSLLGSIIAVVTSVSTGSSESKRALAAENSSLTDVYFGVGCFWHIQHEFVQGERDLLERGDHELTSRTGYAGGKNTDSEGRVCYHNYKDIADYGKLGHGEAVGMRIPEGKIGAFANLYFSLFSQKTGERVDPGDRGGEYRYLIGLPGGTSHPEYAKVEAAAKASGKALVPGKGDEGDTIDKGIVYLYDTVTFPFHQAEVYHQYHDDFQSPAYGKKYNSLANLALEDGRIKATGCPGMF